jgi:hypothetical protein
VTTSGIEVSSDSLTTCLKIKRSLDRGASESIVKASRPWLVLVINDNIRLYVTNVCFAEQMVS